MNKLIFIFIMLLSTSISYSVDDIMYRKIHNKKNNLIHILEVNPKKFNIISSHASELGKSKTQVSRMARYNKAIMGINGGFFRFSKNNKYATPAGVLKTNGKWHGIAYKPRVAIGWNSNTGDALIDIISTYTYIMINNKKYKINIFNPTNYHPKHALYSHKTMDVINTGCNILIKNNKVSKVNSEAIKVNTDEYLFSVGKKYECKFNENLIGKPAHIRVNLYPKMIKSNKKLWNGFDYIVGGAPLLINKGKIWNKFYSEVKNEKFINGKFARTAIGILPNKNWVFVVAEHNPLLNIIGMNLDDLSKFMHNLGCNYAINLDGGSSSALYISNILEKVFKENSIELGLFQFRPVTDSILVLPKSS